MAKKNGIRKTARQEGRATKQKAKRTGKIIKRGSKLQTRGEKQSKKAFGLESKGKTRKGYVKAGHGAVKQQSGVEMQKRAGEPGYKPKPKRRKRTTVRNPEYPGTPGQKKYITKKGKQVKRPRSI
jgi:hypothetical protein